MSNIKVAVQDGNNVTLQVTPQPRIDLSVDRGAAGPAGSAGPTGPPGAAGTAGPTGPSGASVIGGYPITIVTPANGNALMFLNGGWVNVSQTEITNGGNF